MDDLHLPQIRYDALLDKKFTFTVFRLKKQIEHQDQFIDKNDSRYIILKIRSESSLDTDYGKVKPNREYLIHFASSGFFTAFRFCLDKPVSWESADYLRITMKRPSKNKLIFTQVEETK
jgi:hypothetical protein